MLAWPANSGEVTLWFGILDEIFQEIHNGIDIQDELGAPVYSISDGVVTDIYNDPFFGDVVTIDFLYYGEHKQAKYCFMDVIEVSIGESVTRGQTIGTMSEHGSVRKGHLELRLYKNGVAIDPAPFMVRPDFDLGFLHFPMATSLFTLSRNNSVENYRFERNYDLNEGEVYFRRWAHEYVNMQLWNISSNDFNDRNYLTWSQSRRRARFWYESDNLMIDVYVPGGGPIPIPPEAPPAGVTYIRARGRIVNGRVAVMVDQLLPGESGPGIRIDLDANMGIVDPPYIYRIPGTDMGDPVSLPEASRGGRFFVGWFDTIEPFGNTRFTDDSTTPTSPIRLFARWSNPLRHYAYRYHRETVSISLVGVGLHYRSLITNAVNNWNNALEGNSSVRFTIDPASSNRITVDEFAEDRFGWKPRRDGELDYPQLARFEIIINTWYIWTHASDYDEFVNTFISTFVHELGHAVGLGDNPFGATGNDSIMNHGRRRHEMTKPTGFDVESVNMLYD